MSTTPCPSWPPSSTRSGSPASCGMTARRISAPGSSILWSWCGNTRKSEKKGGFCRLFFVFVRCFYVFMKRCTKNGIVFLPSRTAVNLVFLSDLCYTFSESKGENIDLRIFSGGVCHKQMPQFQKESIQARINGKQRRKLRT